MRKLPACLFICLLACLFSCSEDKVVYDIGEYKVDLATVRIKNNEQFFLLDSEISLLNREIIKNLNDGQRVLLNYSYLSETVSGYDHVIKVNNASLVILDKLSAVNSVTIDTIANDPIRLESIWIGNKYLNISFYMNYNSQKHSISLITDKSKTDEESINIYFRHNNNNDAPGYLRRVIASFDLSEILVKPDSDRILITHVYSDNYGEKEYRFRY